MNPWFWVLLAAFLRPAVEFLMVATGVWHYHADFRTAPARFSRLIIQITTTGREHERVTEIIATIRTYRLSMNVEIWVVLEPGEDPAYGQADKVIVVPAEFTTASRYKGRALEYSRLVRERLGLNTAAVKILCLDDDTLPTQAYIETAYAGDYDVCQGVTAPRLGYGRGSRKHVILSHMDDMRFACCFVYCSFFQGVARRPLYVHGEGLCFTGYVESVVQWNKPIFASEDLVFGQNAAATGFSWGFFHEYIQMTSPFTWSDYLRQRRRWFWGNMHAVFHAGILPAWGRIIVLAKYVLGLLTFLFSTTAVVLIADHDLSGVSGAAYALFRASLLAWLLVFAASGWVNSGSDPAPASHRGRYLGHRLIQTGLAVLLCPLTAVWTPLALVIVAARGNPKRFEVIDKSDRQSGRSLPRTRSIPRQKTGRKDNEAINQ